MRKGIIGAGNWIVDRVKHIDRWPEEGELCNITGQEIGGGGGPCNVLFDIAAMNCDIPLFACGMVGHDAEGDYLIDELEKHNIADGFMHRSDSSPTSFTDVMTVTGTGRRTFFHNRGANAGLSFDHFESLDVNAKIFYLGYLLLLDGLDQPDAEFGTVGAKVLELMSCRQYKTVVDIVSEDSKKFSRIIPPALKYIDCLVINEVEAGSSCGIKVRRNDGTPDLDALKTAANNLLDNGVRELIVIHFPEGALAVEKDGTVHALESCELDRKDIVGSVGAGDAFCSGIVYGLHENLSIIESLKIASAAAWFNLHSATATGGAPSLKQMNDYLATCNLKPLE